MIEARRRLLLPAVAAGGDFDPLSISGCTLWLDAADPAVFTYGTGTQVATWADKSPNAFSFAQGTGSKRPTRNRTVNGLDALDFVAASSQTLGVGSSIQLVNSSNGRFTAFAVWVSDDVTQTRLVFDADRGTRIAQFIRTTSSTVQAIGFNGGSARFANGATTITNGTTYITSTMADGTNLIVRLNGSAEASGAHASPNSGMSDASGVGSNAFGSGSETAWWDGAICEVLCYNSALSNGDRDDVYAYLADKWT